MSFVFLYRLRSLDETWQSFYPAAIQPSWTLNKLIIIIIIIIIIVLIIIIIVLTIIIIFIILYFNEFTFKV